MIVSVRSGIHVGKLVSIVSLIARHIAAPPLLTRFEDLDSASIDSLNITASLSSTVNTSTLFLDVYV